MDAARADTVRAKLEALEVPLFMDHKLVSGDDYIRVINEQLDTAVAVLVLWTTAAVDMSAPAGTPNFVLSEAERGFYRGILVAATFDKLALSRLPVPFNRFQAPDVSDWIDMGASAKHPGWQSVLKALGNKLGRPGLADLAIAIESTDESLKKKVLNEYQGDPAAKRIIADIEAFEQSEFESRFTMARKRIQQRAREAERKLRTCRDEFEAQLVELRAGRNFMPPDPVAALDDNAATLSNQVHIHENTIEELRSRHEQAEASRAKATAEISVLGEQVKQLQQQIQASDSSLQEQRARAQRAEINTAETSEKLKQHLKGQRRQVVAWTGSSAMAAAILFGLLGRWSNSGGDAAIHEQLENLAKKNANLSAEIRDLTAKNESLTRDDGKWRASYADLQRQDVQKISDLTAKNQSLTADYQKYTDLQRQGLQKISDLTAKIQSLTADNQKYTDLHRQDALRISELQSSLGTLTTQLNGAQADAKAKEAELAKDKTALASIPIIAQCDLLAGYQYDADRPQSSGWADSVGNVADAQAICDRARQGVGSDPRAERRTLLALGRVYVAARAPDTALPLWAHASAMGSSHAAFELGRYYADRGSSHFDANKAWSYYTRAADMVPSDPVALYWVAYNYLFPDDRDASVIAPAQGNVEKGQEYLQKALNADFPTAYFIAGVYYWHKSKTERSRDDQNADIGRATRYFTMAWCIKHTPRPPEKTADQFYFGQTGKHLSCE